MISNWLPICYLFYADLILSDEEKKILHCIILKSLCDQEGILWEVGLRCLIRTRDTWLNLVTGLYIMRRIITRLRCNLNMSVCMPHWQRNRRVYMTPSWTLFIVEQGVFFFFYGYGGTGKTFLWKTLAAGIRRKGDIVLNVAYSGIASLLMSGGRTAHSRFHIPINVK